VGEREKKEESEAISVDGLGTSGESVDKLKAQKKRKRKGPRISNTKKENEGGE